MVLFMVLILVIIGASIMAWIFWVINPFVEELWNIQRYNKAYYGAIASIERAELVLRWHTAWFEGSWWCILKKNIWNNSDFQYIKKSYFWTLALTWMWNWILWEIKSMTNWVVPEPWKWNLDPDISSWNNYEKLTFDHSLQYALYKDTTPIDKAYTWVSDDKIKNINIANWITISIRTPSKLTCKYNWQNNNCSRSNISDLLDNNDIDLDGDGVKDDIIVNRSLFWFTWTSQFTIFPSIKLNSDWTAPASNDTAIREDVINNYLTNKQNIIFDTTSKDTNPCNWWTHTSNVNNFNQAPDNSVSTWFDFILNTNYWNTTTLEESKNNWKIWQMNLKLSLVNLLSYDEWENYPYLEVRLNTGSPIPDLNFHILWEWKVMEYDVRIIISQPIFNSNAASDFTVLF